MSLLERTDNVRLTHCRHCLHSLCNGSYYDSYNRVITLNSKFRLKYRKGTSAKGKSYKGCVTYLLPGKSGEILTSVNGVYKWSRHLSDNKNKKNEDIDEP